MRLFSAAHLTHGNSRSAPYGWAGLNGGLLAVMWGLGFMGEHTPPIGKLWLLVFLSAIVFVVDVFVFNYYLNRRDSGVTPN